MKILYAIQATGNGHLARAREIIPELAQKVDLDILISGIQGDLKLPYPVTYKKYGLSFIFGKQGRIDYFRTMNSLRPVRLWRDIKECPVDQYDLVIHDFEPISAHACKIRNVPNVSLSHQAAFLFAETPRPQKKNPYAEWVLRNYAPAGQAVGLHFNTYHPSIFTPIIRKEIRNLSTEFHEHVLVYLPAYCPYFLASLFQKLPKIKWRIFSRHTINYLAYKNIETFPVGNETWLESLRTCQAAIIGAGFEGPSEVLFLGKKLMVIPMKNQYEQKCNATALKEIGIKTMHSIHHKKMDEIEYWLQNCEATMIPFPDQTSSIIDHILKVS